MTAFTVGPFGSEILVNAETGSYQSHPNVTGLASGGFVVTWTDSSGTLGDDRNTSIKAQIFDADSRKSGSEFLVNTETISYQFNSKAVGLAGGGFVVSWIDFSGTLGDDSGSSIKAQIFDAAGVKIGTEFLVNTETVSDQWNPTITGLSNGDFVVTWSDFSCTLGDSDGTSIKAQVFALNPVLVDMSSAQPGSASVSVLEGKTTVAAVIGIGANAGTTLSYSIVGGDDAELFQIDASTGALSFKAAPDFESPADAGSDNVYDLVVQVSDGTLTSSQSVAVTVTNVNEAPAITSDGGAASASISIAENQAAVTTVTAADPDAGTTLTYSIAGGDDAGLFQIDASTGALSFKVAPDFESPADTGADNVYDVVVEASDGALTTSQTVAVTVTNANEAPVGYSSGAFGPEILVNTETAGYQSNPTVTRLLNGGFVVTWTDSSGTLGDAEGTSIKAQVFGADGEKVGSEFLVN